MVRTYEEYRESLDGNMNQKPFKTDIKSLILWVAFGSAVTFTTTILVFWIFQDIANRIPMSILIGALLGLAFKLFADRINKSPAK